MLLRILASAALLALSTTNASVAEDEPRPRLVLPESRFDLGEVPFGSDPTQLIRVVNEGNAPLTIHEVQSGCLCVTVEFDTTVPPGGEGTISAHLVTSGLEGRGSSVLTIMSDDPERPGVKVELHAEVVHAVRAEPGFGRWNTVQGEREGTIAQTLWAEDGEDFAVLRVETPLPQLRAEVAEATEAERKGGFPGKQWRVSLTLDSDSPVGALSGTVLVYLDHPIQEVVRIPVSGFVRPRFHLHPDHGDFAEIQLDGPKSAIFELTVFSSQGADVTAASTDIEGIEIATETRVPRHEYRFTLTFTEELPEGVFEGRLLIETDDESSPRIELPLSGDVVHVAREGDEAR